MSTSAPFTHVAADLRGVSAVALSDAAGLSGLLIAAAGAAGFTALGSPIVRQLPSGGVAGVLLLDACHIAVHAFPDKELLLLDIIAPASRDVRKALDVFARRLAPREIRNDTRPRG